MKRTLCFQNLIKYKTSQAIVRNLIKTAKRKYWRKYCDTLGRTTPFEKEWGKIKKMSGSYKEYGRE